MELCLVTFARAQVALNLVITRKRKMTKDEIIAILRHNERAPVELAITLANLTKKEETVIKLCGCGAMTQAEAAEQMDRSTDAVQKWYSSAIKKLGETWSGMKWVRNMIL